MSVTVLLPLLLLLPLATADGFSGKVLLVSMDGFRWDYIKTVSGLGNFSRLAREGVSVDYVNPVFTTKTFPSHYSIATGLYEESHGIVGNSMYDPEHNATFNKGSHESFWWNGGEPVWITAVRQGKKAGVIFWPGGESEIRGYLPTEALPYNESMPFSERVNMAFNWLTEKGMHLVAVYFHEPDGTGHKYGPDSTEIADMVREMDGVLGQILARLEEEDTKDVNLVLTSDHGMTGVDMQNRLIDLYGVIGDRTMVQMVVQSGAVTAILPAAGRKDELVTALKRIDHVTVYRKEEIPDRFHYRDNPRITPVIILADEGWTVSTDPQGDREWNEKGDHGFDNALPSMKQIFFARGPDFKQGVKISHISEVDVYPLVCKLLNVQASENNGTLDSTRAFLKVGGTGSASQVTLSYGLMLLVACFVVWGF